MPRLRWMGRYTLVGNERAKAMVKAMVKTPARVNMWE